MPQGPGSWQDKPVRRFLLLLMLLAACESHEPAGPPKVAKKPPPRPTALTAVSDAVPGEPPRAAPVAEPPAPPTPPKGMLLVPGGTFIMGADEGGEPDEHPAHRVTVKAFYLDRTEVTNEAYSACVKAKKCGAHYEKSAQLNGFGSDRGFRGPRQPVSAIGWYDAEAYCAFVGHRLPTEAEWERAARGDDGRRYPWGDEEPTPAHARYRSGQTADVGSFSQGAGPYGHLDLAGNVWEWVADPYDPLAYRRHRAGEGHVPTCSEAVAAYVELKAEGKQGFTGSNPIPTECEYVLRGGAFNYFPGGLRSTNRVHHEPTARLVMSGFRCAADLP